MKKIYVFSALLVLFLLGTAASYKASITTSPPPPPPTDSTVLILPDEHYEYRNIPFPDHVLLPNGWSGGSIDTSLVDQITNAGATLGRVLFYDNILSINQDQSCGSCHLQERSFADSVAFSAGFEGELTTRNTLHLNDLGYFPEDGNGLFWDLSSPTLQEAVTLPIINEAELGLSLSELVDRLNATDYYPPLFEEAYGSTEVTEEKLANALTQFIASIRSFESKFDVGAAVNFQNFTQIESLGQSLFITNCEICHSQSGHFGIDAFELMPPFFLFNNNGLEEEYTDQGMAEWSGVEEHVGVFKGPSLKNVAVTAPYMHDGRFETLEEVVDFYSDDVFNHPNSLFSWFMPLPSFEESEKTAIVAFLQTLTDDNLLTNPMWSDPFVTITTSTDDIPAPLLTARIYPNPMVDHTMLYLNNPEARQIDLRLATTEGKSLRQWTSTSAEILIERDQLAAGIYFLTIQLDGKVRSLRLVVR